MNIMNKAIISELVEREHIVVTVGGDGIPIYKHENNHLEAIEAVIDKDLASSLLATMINADTFYIFTDVPKVYLNFNKKDQIALDELKIEDAKKYLSEGQFAMGSMGPKILAAANFIESGGREAIITEASQVGKEGSGTRIIN